MTTTFFRISVSYKWGIGVCDVITKTHKRHKLYYSYSKHTKNEKKRCDR